MGGEAFEEFLEVLCGVVPVEGLGGEVVAGFECFQPGSFDIFLQRFRGGDGATGGREEALRVLTPLLAGPSDGHSGNVHTDDGDAEVYGLGTDGLMFTHASGRLIWQVIVDVARAADYVIMPVGCPVGVTAAHHIDELPAELRDNAVVVETGDDVIRVVTTA